ncbi:MAG: hypothetical protein LBR80_14190 [Deltaproteobacteria bacterium]|nr:hypothetical protein [Deltaproteobacteria bacterium]
MHKVERESFPPWSRGSGFDFLGDEPMTPLARSSPMPTLLNVAGPDALSLFR